MGENLGYSNSCTIYDVPSHDVYTCSFIMTWINDKTEPTIMNFSQWVLQYSSQNKLQRIITYLKNFRYIETFRADITISDRCELGNLKCHLTIWWCDKCQFDLPSPFVNERISSTSGKSHLFWGFTSGITPPKWGYHFLHHVWTGLSHFDSLIWCANRQNHNKFCFIPGSSRNSQEAAIFDSYCACVRV